MTSGGKLLDTVFRYFIFIYVFQLAMGHQTLTVQGMQAIIKNYAVFWQNTAVTDLLIFIPLLCYSNILLFKVYIYIKQTLKQLLSKFALVTALANRFLIQEC